MAVAKSFAKYGKVGEPYTVNGKQYIKVKHPISGNVRQVRWYSDWEYNKLYPDTPIVSEKKSQKEVLGFTKGYITIFKGDTYANLDWFRASIARYARWWGWYIISTEEVPADLPEGLEPMRLKWEDVSADGISLIDEGQIKAFVETLVFEPSGSEYVGQIGERLELYVTIDKRVTLEGAYGQSNMHIMHDDCGNEYVWITAAKSWDDETEHRIKATVKDHRLYKNSKQTILTRCMSLD